MIPAPGPIILKCESLTREATLREIAHEVSGRSGVRGYEVESSVCVCLRIGEWEPGEKDMHSLTMMHL